MVVAHVIQLDMRAEHLTDAEIAGYLDDDMPPQHRSRAEAHMETCAQCRTAVVEVMRAVDSAPSLVRGTPPARRIARPGWLTGTIGLAAAAGIAAVLLARPQAPVSPPAERATPASIEARRTIAIVAPIDGATVTRAGLRFTWRASGSDLYRVSLLSESGDLLWGAETSDTLLALPETVRLERGRTYFWRVDGVTAGISASTAAPRFTIR